MSAHREPIAVIGTGYVGLVTAAGFAEFGNDVWCVDVDADKIAQLNRGEIPIYEPGLAASVARNRDRLHFDTELAPALEHARLLFVAVGTPPTYSGDADLSAVDAVVASMPPSDHHALVMKSTVPVGTGATIKRMFAEQGKSGFAYVSCPEFLKEGSALEDFLHPDRVVVGDEGGWAGDAVVELYRPLDAPLVRTDIASAEMVKLAANAFLATKISFINEIANVCELTGADVGEVARGIGLDQRIGPHFLKAGIGFGGSCLTGEESVLVRHRGRTTLITLERLWDRIAAEDEEYEQGVLGAPRLEVLSWVPGDEEPMFLPVMCLTRRPYEGDVIEVRTKMGRSLRCTPDHPWIVGDGADGEPEVKLAEELTSSDWVPVALGRAERAEDCEPTRAASLMAVAGAAELLPDQLIVRPLRAEVPLRESTLSTTRNGNRPRSDLQLGEPFWRVVGLYIAGGNALTDPFNRWRIQWSFHSSREPPLVDEVVAYWLTQNVHARPFTTPTSQRVEIASRLLGVWWTQVLGLGRNCYEQRLPDLIWEQPESIKWALLSGLFEGGGSWSLVGRGPSVILELGTVSDELADGVLRLLGDVGIVASERTGPVRKSTKDTHWIRISGADQVERAIRLVPERDRVGVLISLGRQQKRIAPPGYRGFGKGPAWVRVVSTERKPYSGPVYSLEVPVAHSFVTTDGLTVHNCFPKDVSALKQLAGNSGYHFQLLTSVIEVNELQKRRVIAKLQKHLGSLVGKQVALLGLAFKANTDDMREASALVLSARLQADGAGIRAYDPVAEQQARKLMGGVDFAESALEALDGADACVLVTEWPEFAELDWDEVAGTMRGRVVVDGRNFLDPDRVRAAGLIYDGIGR